MEDKARVFTKLWDLQLTTFMMPQTNPPARHVFVYGTLRAGGSNDITRYRPAPQRFGDAAVCGTLYDLGAYPGLLLEGSQHVVGEVYRVDSTVERELDVLESVMADDSGEYIKRTVELEVNGQVITCLLYEIHPDRIAGRAVIAHGDWLVHANGTRT